MNRMLVGANGLEAGSAFPTGVNVNHIAAHFTPNPEDDDYVLTYDDVMAVSLTNFYLFQRLTLELMLAAI